jgi:hypothetical protein
MTTPAEDKEMAAFVAWAVKQYGRHAYRHTSATSGEWAAWQAGRAALPAPLSEGALMGVYIEFDRHADKTWPPAEYLLRFAAAVQNAVLAGPNAAGNRPAEGRSG